MIRILLALCALVICSDVAAGEPYTYHMTCYQGGDCRTTFRFKAAGKAMDLTGTVFSGQVRNSYTATSTMAELAIDSSNLKDGYVTAVIPAATLATLAGKTGYWDLRQTDMNGAVQYRVRGQWKCLYSATR